MPPQLRRIYRQILLPLVLSGWMVSCSPLNPWGWAQNYVDIGQLSAITNQKAVNLQGIVVNVAPFLEGGAYQIEDKTGKVWVKTDGPLPPKGTVVSLRGEVAYEAIFIGPEKLGESYVIEIRAPQPVETSQETPPLSNGTEGTPIAVEEGTMAPESPIAVEGDQLSPESSPVSPPEEPTSPTVVPDSSVTVETPDIPPESPTSLPVANPAAPRPIANPIIPQPVSKPRLNLDDQFLPHKRFAK